jgi:hypothetical protein
MDVLVLSSRSSERISDAFSKEKAADVSAAFSLL